MVALHSQRAGAALPRRVAISEIKATPTGMNPINITISR
jgi:hypothetical protein